jgi:hypothetical protein
MTIAQFADLQRAVFACHSAGKYEEGLEILNANAHHHPRHAHSTTIWKAAFAALTGQSSLATWTLEEGLAAGYWWADELLSGDPDFASLAGNADFKHIVSECFARKAEAERHSRPLMTLVHPDEAAGSAAGTLMVLHGSAWTASSFARRWHAAPGTGWLLAVPQSSQMSGPEHYGWLDDEVARREVAAHAARTTPHIIGGFWSGASLALQMIRDATLHARGFIACGMVLDPDDASIDSTATALADQGVPVALFGGRGDPFEARGLEALAAAVERRGGRALVDVRADLAHDFPPDFDAALPEALAFLTNSSSATRGRS